MTTSSNNKTDNAALDRRAFFRMGGMGAAAAATTAMTGTAPAAESASEKVKARYRETEHVKNYYRVNRY